MGSQLHQSAMATPCLKSSVPSMSDGVIEECELKIESVEIVLTKSPFLAAAKKGGRHTLGIAIDYALQHNSLSHLFRRRKILLAATISAHFGFQSPVSTTHFRLSSNQAGRSRAVRCEGNDTSGSGHTDTTALFGERKCFTITRTSGTQECN